MTATRSALLLLLFLSGLPLAADASDAAAEARAISSELVQRLGAELRKALSDSGPDGAIAVCRDIAPSLAGELSRRTGWRVARVSLKTRNPLIGGADAWEQKVLQDFDRAVAHGKPSDSLEWQEIVPEPEGRYLRYMKALPVQPVCLNCHGGVDSLPVSVRNRLARDYPHDRATGYSVGEIRGAITIKQALSPGD
jgi:hypothetical protein